MADSFNFELVSPEQLLVSAKVTEIVLPGSDGEMTVLANHSPVMTTIRPGVVTVKQEDGQTEKYVVFGGFADILPNSCTLLAESALPVAEFRRDALAKRIELAKADLEIVHSDDGKTRATQLVSDLEGLASVAG
jgi:F-type H+-transporting ATPase subunit epsilon